VSDRTPSSRWQAVFEGAAALRVHEVEEQRGKAREGPVGNEERVRPPSGPGQHDPVAARTPQRRELADEVIAHRSPVHVEAAAEHGLPVLPPAERLGVDQAEVLDLERVGRPAGERRGVHDGALARVAEEAELGGGDERRH
jgi:hypothetical protein